jgi:hypothetical protein
MNTVKTGETDFQPMIRACESVDEKLLRGNFNCGHSCKIRLNRLAKDRSVT